MQSHTAEYSKNESHSGGGTSSTTASYSPGVLTVNNKGDYNDEALKNTEKTLSNLNQKLKSLNLKDFNDIVAMENIIRLLDANDTIKNERNVKRRASRDGSSVKVNNSYSVIVANDDLSKNLISLIRRVTQLSNNELENIQESFLTNKIDDIVSSLDSSKNLIDDTKDVVSVLMKYFSAKNTTKYEKESILKDIAALLEKKEEGSSLDQNETKTA